MGIMDKIKRMSMDEFAHICNRLVSEMGFRINNSVYRGDTIVMNAAMPVPGETLRYLIIFLRKDKLTRSDVEELVDFESLKIRWMLITTGEVKNEARKILPKNMDIEILDGRDFERMLQEFGVAESLEEKREEGRYLPSLGEMESLLQWAEEFFKNKNYEKSLDYVDRALKIKITNKGLKLKARILYGMGKHDESVSILKRILEENVEDDESWFLLGNILESMGRIDEADEAYGQCTRFNHRNIGCWLNRGNIMLEKEKYDESLLCFENALKIRQDLPEVWNNRGVVLKQLKKYDEAMRSYNAALKFDPNFAESYLNKSYLFYDLRRYEEAENSVREYLKLKEDIRGYLLLSNIYMKRKLYHEAELTVRKALEIDPTNLEARKILRRITGGKARDIERDIKKAVEDLLNILPEEGFEEIRKIIEEAKNYSLKGNVEKARDKLEEARNKIKEYSDQEKLKSVIIEDIISLSKDLGEVPPDNLDEMELEKLKKYRMDLVKKFEGRKKKEEEEKKKKFLDVIERIASNLRDMSIINDEIESSLEYSKKMIGMGNYGEALERIMSIREKIENVKIEKMRKEFVEDTVEILNEANMDIPRSINSMKIEELKELRRKAIEKIKGEKGEGGIKGFVNALQVGGGIKDEIISDIKEIGEFTDIEIPENLEELGIEELKNLRRNIIHYIKEGKGVKEKKVSKFRGYGQLLYEIGKEDEIIKTLENYEDEYLDNAAGLLYFRKGDYEKSIDYFKRAIAINPDFKETEFNLAYVLHKLKRDKEAKAHLKKIGMEEYFKKR